MMATREDWDQSEKGRRAEPELGPGVMKAAEEQNLPGVGGAESVEAAVPPDRKLSPVVSTDGL